MLFDGIPAPIPYVRSDQINAVVRYGIVGSTTSIQVEYNGQRSKPISALVVAATPSAFTANSSGVGNAAALNQDGSVNTLVNPARPGSIVTLFVTGSVEPMLKVPTGDSVTRCLQNPYIRRCLCERSRE